jgi:hypothetical protein
MGFVLFKKRVKYLDKYLFLMIGFAIVSFTPSILFGFSISLYLGYAIRLTIAFLIVIYLNIQFLDYYENLVFLLACISLPLFFLQVTVPEIFRIFDPLTRAVLHYEGIGTGSSYFFVFFHNGSANLRNSGFLSEPSLFGIVLAWSILINLFKNDFQLNGRFAVMAIAVLTTFSIGAITYLLLILLLYLIYNFKSSKAKNVIAILFVVVLFFPFVGKSRLVQDNIASITWKLGLEGENYYKLKTGQLDETSVSRVSGARINMEYFLKFPLGYGLVRPSGSEYVYLGGSPNGLSNLIVRWGIGFIVFLALGVRYLLIILKSISPRYARQSLGVSFFKIKDLLAMVIFILPLAGYSLFNQPFMIAFLCWPHMYYRYFLKEHYALAVQQTYVH